MVVFCGETSSLLNIESALVVFVAGGVTVCGEVDEFVAVAAAAVKTWVEGEEEEEEGWPPLRRTAFNNAIV